jgi:hypothetical protein
VLSNAIGKDKKDWTRGDEMTVAGILRANGYARKRAPADAAGKRAWIYVRESTP